MTRQLLGRYEERNDKFPYYANVRNSMVENKDPPLQWALYYGDYYGGMALFKEFPLSLMWKNSNDDRPLSIIIGQVVNKRFKWASKFLAERIIEKLFMYMAN